MERTNNIRSCSGKKVVVRHSGSSEFIRISPHHDQLLGFTAEELSARPLLDWIHPEDQAALQRVMKDGAGEALARHRTKTGGWIPLDWRVRSDADGIAMLGLKHGEAVGPSGPEQLGDGNLDGNLRATLIAMARIVEAKNPGMMCSILLVDERGERVTVGAGPSLPDEYNAAVEGLKIGPTVGSCGTAAYWNIPVVVENIAEDPLWRDLREAAKIAGIAACWSHPITATNGEVLGAMALYNSCPRAPEQHHMDGLEIAARMVGLAVERDRLEQQLHEGAKMKALGVLAGGIAHDFNNMLTAVMGNAELALQQMPRDSAARPMLVDIVAASASAADLCRQMLAYVGRGAMSKKPLDCNQLVQELGGLLQVALSKKAELRYELHPEPVWVQADPSQLRQVIMNLITNASEAIGNNIGVITVGTTARNLSRNELAALSPAPTLKPGEYVLIWVSDTGDGMAESIRDKIFDPFFSTKPTGRGLGLAAVQGIIRRHYGAIALEGAYDRGTKFSVLLPRVPASGAVSAASTMPPQAGRGAVVLVVDDEPAVRRTLARMLEGAGYEVLLAEDGQQAIDVFRREGHRIDCVLLDLSMPKLDGDEVFVELKQIRSDVQVILCSGFAEPQVLVRCKHLGLAGTIQKPAKMHVLLEMVAQTLS